MRYRNHSCRRNFGRAAFFADRKANRCFRRSSSLGFARASWTFTSASSSSFAFFGFLRRGSSFTGFSFSGGFSFSSAGSVLSASRTALASSFATYVRRRLRRSSTFPSVLRSYSPDQATSSAFFAARISGGLGSGPLGSEGFSGTAVFFTFFAGFGSSSAMLRLLSGLLRDVDSVLEDPGIEASDPCGQFDVRRRLPDGLDVRAGQQDLVALHLDLGLTQDPSLARELLPEEILDDELGTLHRRFHREMAVDDFHFVGESFCHADDHVPDMGRERPNESALPAARILAPDLRLLAFHDNLDPRMRQLPAECGPLRRDDNGIAVEADLHAPRDLDGFFQQPRDRHRPPQ